MRVRSFSELFSSQGAEGLGLSAAAGNIGALIVRMGAWGVYCTLTILRNPQNPILIIKASTVVFGMLGSAARRRMIGLCRPPGRRGWCYKCLDVFRCTHMYMYVYIHTYMNTCVYVCRYVRIYIYIYIYIYICVEISQQ